MEGIMTKTAPLYSIPWRCRLHGEPLLSELLDDPVLQLLMRRDGVSAGALRQLARPGCGPKQAA
jgi:hypothetical protein